MSKKNKFRKDTAYFLYVKWNPAHKTGSSPTTCYNSNKLAFLEEKATELMDKVEFAYIKNRHTGVKIKFFDPTGAYTASKYKALKRAEYHLSKANNDKEVKKSIVSASIRFDFETTKDRIKSGQKPLKSLYSEEKVNLKNAVIEMYNKIGKIMSNHYSSTCTLYDGRDNSVIATIDHWGRMILSDKHKSQLASLIVQHDFIK